MLFLLNSNYLTDADAALNRYAQFMGRWSTISVDIRARINAAGPEAKAKLTLKKPQCAAFDVSWNGVQYLFRQNESRIVEADRTAKRYRDYNSFSTWTSPPGDLSMVPQYAFPSILLLGDLRGVRSMGSFKLRPSPPGVRAATITAKMQTMGGAIDYLLKIDELGRPLHIQWIADSPDGKMRVDQYFSNWIVDRAVPASTFSGALPSGFVPDALPLEPSPLAIDQAFPVADWSTPIGFFGSSNALVVVADSQCSPSKKLIEFLAQSKGEIGAKVGVAWIGSPGASRNLAVLQAKAPSAWKKLHLSGTPALYLVGKNGTVKKLWIGFEGRSSSSLKQEIVEALRS